ncbi:uncharacterized protein K452DRAFT_157354 [Aplosporella prunicola CBS 121167]|uniref:Stress response protein NST1 n=1 Tax=Aplosporella prunicola CBS 121167 TaxID=1176127 RepID=A0A6A6AY80_9PEZI|nr:uncharacterized protein K452DRAFT_157354 [Aplosporella prunicola CBS 121167]KAF2135935.1 hypothetical protein K452DRAFT_157354 [Aplosporella prunicola CBS 121167]
MAQAKSLPQPTNGVLTAGQSVAVNRKKAKRRAKQQAKLQAEHHANSPQAHASEDDFDDPVHFESADADDLYYTEDEAHAYSRQVYAQDYDASAPAPNGQFADAYPPAAGSDKKARRKKKKGQRGSQQLSYGYDLPSGSSSGMLPHSGAQVPPPPPPPPPPLSSAALRSVQRSANSKDRIWNTSTQEERERIRDFWLSLGEEERKSLVKIEKEAVLRKMKEQQKHSCSCTVCGRKRTAIEEELEVLYDAYYEELELPYSHTQDPPLPPDRMLPAHPPYDSGNRVEELGDEEEEEEDEEFEDDEDYESDEEEDLEDEEEPEELPPRGPAADFFNFGNSLTVKGGILTVADDLLKNDGKKFIEMMEQLAERRMQREDQVVEHAGSLAYSQSMQNSHAGHNHGPPPEDEDYDDEEEYDSQEDEDYEEDEDDLDSMTEQQRMREGRRMFQIFAARMFEQRVLSAYREKVANERQQKLIEELAEEERRQEEQALKKARDAQKKKDKKALQRQRQAEEKARKEAEKKAEEEATKAIEAKKQEEQRRKKEEAKKKKEAERKAQEEEKKRKEIEKQKRLADDRARHQESERKQQEQRALEKKTREDAKKREREEREAREKEAREQKAHAEQQRREKEARIKAEKEAKERARKEDQATQASQQGQKRPSQPTPALPPGLLSKQPSAGFPSPLVQIATPNIPKAPTPVRPRQSSQQESHSSSPHTPSAFPGMSKSVSPSNTSQQSGTQPKTILQKPQNLAQSSTMHHPQPATSLPPLGAPPGMFPPPGVGFGGLPGLNGPSPPMIHGLGQRGPMGSMPMFPRGPPPMGGHYPGFPQPNGMPPPGMGAPGMPLGRGFPLDMPPGFGSPVPSMSTAAQIPGFSAPRDIMPSHSRQASASGSFDKGTFGSPLDGPHAQPIARPTPIQRPSSVKPHEHNLENKKAKNADVDDLSNHLGSSALLDDSDEPIPTSAAEARRASIAPTARSSAMAFGTSPLFADTTNRARIDPFGLPSGGSSTWGAPGGMAFGPPGLPGSTWGSSPTSGGGWPTHVVGSFGSVAGGTPHHRASISRPVSVRVMVCAACKQLAASAPSPDGFYDIATVLRTIEAGTFRGAGEAPVSLDEVLDICETEGDAHNGGGFLLKREGSSASSGGGGVAVKFEPDNPLGGGGGAGAAAGLAAGPAASSTTVGGMRIPGARARSGLGEIGSPVPGHSVPFGVGVGGATAAAARASPFAAAVGSGLASPTSMTNF